MAQSSPIVGCGRPEVGGFNVRHARSVNAETRASVMISANPCASLTHLPDRRNPRTKVSGVHREPREAPRSGGVAGRLVAAAGRGGACAATQGHPFPPRSISVPQASRHGPSAAPDLINSCPRDPPISWAPEGPPWPDTAQFVAGNPLSPARSGQSNKRPECRLDARRTSVHPAVALGSLALRGGRKFASPGHV